MLLMILKNKTSLKVLQKDLEKQIKKCLELKK